MKYLLFLSLFLSFFVSADDDEIALEEKPLIERYVLDELRDLRASQQDLKIDVNRQLVENRIENNDRTIEYATSTLNNIFYIVTVAATLLVLVGWRSINDVKQTVDTIINKKIDKITKKYEDRLDIMEQKIKNRSDEIIANQEEISNTNVIHSLWMRAGLEKSNREKLKIYDQILEIKNDDVGVLTYKADTLLDMDKAALALELTNQAIALDANYALAYWQRACARCELNMFDDAITDIKHAIAVANPLVDKVSGEVHFYKLHDHPEYKKIISKT